MKSSKRGGVIGQLTSSRLWQIGLLLVVLVLGIAFMGSFGSKSGTVIKPGETLRAQQWEALSGEAIDPKAYVGQPLLVNVWASWCIACVNELPLLEAASTVLQDVNIVALNFEESAEKASQYITRYDLSLDVLLDQSGSLRQIYPIRELPLTLLFDAQGRFVDKRIGAFSEVADIAAFIELAQP